MITKYEEFINENILDKIMGGIDRGIGKFHTSTRPIRKAISTTFIPEKMYKTIKNKFEQIKLNFDFENLELVADPIDRDTKFLVYTDEDEIKLEINMFYIPIIYFNGEDITSKLNSFLTMDIYKYFITKWNYGNTNKISGQIFSDVDSLGEEDWSK
jgi:hypothetical protein